MVASTAASWQDRGTTRQEWFAIDLRQPTRVAEAKLAFYAEPGRISAPTKIQVQRLQGTTWTALESDQKMPAARPVANGITVLKLRPVSTQRIRFLFTLPANATNIRLVSAEVYAEEN